MCTCVISFSPRPIFLYYNGRRKNFSTSVIIEKNQPGTKASVLYVTDVHAHVRKQTSLISRNRGSTYSTCNCKEAFWKQARSGLALTPGQIFTFLLTSDLVNNALWLTCNCNHVLSAVYTHIHLTIKYKHV